MLQMKVVGRTSPHWNDSKVLIKKAYEKAFQANIQSSYKDFIVCCKNTLQDGKFVDETVACVGFQSAADGNLFSEVYLPKPVEAMISEMEGRIVSRSSILECGGLASKSTGAGSELVRAVPLLTWCMGTEFLLVTATKSLRFIMEKCGIEYSILCDAVPVSLSQEDKASWGNYYKTDPKCVVVNVIKNRNNTANTAQKYLFDREKLSFSVRRGA